MIKRFNQPTHLDVMEFMEEWHHELEDGSVQIWVQTNEIVDDSSKPQWVRLGDLFERCYIKEECDTCIIEHFAYVPNHPAPRE